MNEPIILVGLWAFQAAATIWLVPDQHTRAVLSLIGFTVAIIAATVMAFAP